MDLMVEPVDDVTVVVLRGEHLDASNSGQFESNIAPIIAANRRVVLDMSYLTFVDSSGLGAILGCLRRLGEMGGDLKLFGLSKSVKTVFQITRMHRIFDISDSREQAVSAFQG